MDRLIAFYERVFDARVVADMKEEGLRHVFIDVSGVLLHPFQIPGVDVPQGELPVFGRGRIDHVALKADSAEGFWDLRDRIHDAGASDGPVTDMGVLLSAGFTDPDGVWGEVCWDKPPEQASGSGLRAEWRYIAYPERA
jgi:catechol 2,3-dioxygenase-like lactoylglutathione lyase family enzyme